MKSFYMILTALLLNSCMSKSSSVRENLKQSESEAIFLLEQVNESIKKWEIEKMPKSCVPSIDSGFMNNTIHDFSQIKSPIIQQFNALEKIRNKKIIELLVTDSNQSVQFSIEVLSLNGDCVSYEINKIISD